MDRKRLAMERQDTEIYRLMERLDLGSPVEEPAAVKGGLLHKMFRTVTTAGIFAVKQLNPEIMKRPEALQNTIHSEEAAAGFAPLFPVVSAMKRRGTRVHKLEDHYYLVYPWIDGKSIFPGEIRAEHCRIMGEILGRMHHRKLWVEGIYPETDDFEVFPWDRYARRILEEGDARGGGGKCRPREWMRIYLDALEDIRQWNEAACRGGETLFGERVLSHRDLDPKNVMWKDGGEIVCAGVIDWEAAGYVNPCQEFAELLHYWADDGKGGMNRENMDALVSGYSRYRDIGSVEWKTVFQASCMGILGWLEYNVRRALGIEAADQAEVCLGEEQVIRTVKELYSYQAKVAQAAERLSEYTKYGLL